MQLILILQKIIMKELRQKMKKIIQFKKEENFFLAVNTEYRFKHLSIISYSIQRLFR